MTHSRLFMVYTHSSWTASVCSSYTVSQQCFVAYFYIFSFNLVIVSQSHICRCIMRWIFDSQKLIIYSLLLRHLYIINDMKICCAAAPWVLRKRCWSVIFFVANKQIISVTNSNALIALFFWFKLWTRASHPKSIVLQAHGLNQQIIQTFLNVINSSIKLHKQESSQLPLPRRE